MKKLLFIFVLMSALATAGVSFYAYFVYIPQKIEQKIISSFNEFGFEDLHFGAIERENGKLIFSNISLDKQSFSVIGELSVHFSLFKFLLNPDHAQKIVIRNLNLTGELSRKFDLVVSGWKNEAQFFQNIREIPASIIIVEDSSLDILSETIGGIRIEYDGNLQLLNSNEISINGRVFSKQKKVTFHSKIKGLVSDNGDLNVTAESEQISIASENLSIRRGAATLKFFHSKINSSSALSAEMNLASMNWYKLPLRDVNATIENSGVNYNLVADGKTFGPENIEWSTHVNKVGGVTKVNSIVTPYKFTELLSFLKRNDRLAAETNFPRFLLHFEAPVFSINSTISKENLNYGNFNVLISKPNFEINGDYALDNENRSIKGNFYSDNAFLTSDYDLARFRVASSGNFNISYIDKMAKIDWIMEALVKNGQIIYGALKIPDIAGKFLYNSNNPNKTNRNLNFKLPLKPTILQKGTVRLNTTDEQNALFKTIMLDIYGGRIKTKNPIFEDGNLLKSNKLIVSDINLTQLFHDANFSEIVISGQLGGVIPFKIEDKRVNVSGGILQSQGGGTIKLPSDIIYGLFSGPSRKMHIIRESLKNYHYEFFEIRLDGDLTGRVMMTLNASGYNPDFNDKEPVDLSLQIETQISLLFKNLLK